MSSSYQRPSGRWTALANDASGKEVNAGTWDTKDEADRIAEEKERWLRTGNNGMDPAVRALMTLEDYYTNHYHPEIEPGTKRNYRLHFKLRVLPAFGKTRLAAIETVAVREWLAELKKQGVSDYQRRGARAALSSVLNMAVEDGFISANPVLGVKLPEARRKEIKILTAAQMERFYASFSTDGASLMAELEGVTGMRLEEVTALIGDDFDPKTRGLKIRRRVIWLDSLDHPDGKYGPLVLKGTKSKKLEHAIAVNVAVSKKLAEWIAANKIGPDDLIFARELVRRPRESSAAAEEQELTPEFVATLGEFVPEHRPQAVYRHGTITGYTRGRCRCQWCTQAARQAKREQLRRRRGGRDFAQLATEHLPPNEWYSLWREACDKAELGWYPKNHHLRHSHASGLLQKGVDPFAVMRRLGQSDLSVTQLYAHGASDLDHDVADA